MKEQTDIAKLNKTLTDIVKTLEELKEVCANDSMTTTGNPTTDKSQEQQATEELNAFFYIVVVLFFYAFAMVVLMVKYVHREKRDMELERYFVEFVRRDKFHTPRYENRKSIKALYDNTKFVSQMMVKTLTLLPGVGLIPNACSSTKDREYTKKEMCLSTTESDLHDCIITEEYPLETDCVAEETDSDISSVDTTFVTRTVTLLSKYPRETPV